MSKQYIMFDVSDDRAEAIAEALGNKTCKRILSLLAEKDLSESDIAAKLKIPLNTAHYNVQKLVSSGLVEQAKGFFWSVKGKKVATYRLSNKRIIISPKESFKGVLPVMIATGALAFFVSLFTRSADSNAYSSIDSAGAASRDVALTATQKIAGEGAAMASGAYNAAPQFASDAVVTTANASAISPWSWFLLGAWAALLIFVIFQIWKEHSQK